MSTIVDVSKLAGVSKATVSRVINGTGQVKQSTKDSVFAAMEELGYRPNRTAQALATNKTDTIALVLSNYDSARWGTLLHQVSIQVQQAGKTLTVIDGMNDPQHEYEVIRQSEGQCDAILLYSRTLTDDHIQELESKLSTPLVVLNRVSTKGNYHSVSIDQFQLIHTAMQHLISNGHKSIACITGPIDNPTGKARIEGYKHALHASKLPYNPSLVQSGDYHIRSGYETCQKLMGLSVKFTAIIAFNDNMALGAIKALAEQGISVPDQVSIIGVDNDPHGEFSTPELSTVELPIEEMAKHAVKLALQLRDEALPYEPKIFQGNLLNRNSVIPFHANKAWLSF
ncbi:transcriptional regulator LacI family [Vibrio maritimus]|uniref:Transcriptional regulator LacI family n=1 Tax=Vibrio maritimus TaxID=990268 RepID=A0A090SZU1_9VIBR|nr:transcriptional regulator LacI family [Vibrio maritimus]